ncbi:flagellar type III secretion system protein FlhB [Roseobacter ponti]|uniref:Flagellar biosynthesis protein FlhB n=1 Tax=Roseobacter ponti TaxID=1891787 RepID=A0A858T167_9RHOB|nr:flagellar type III secretion system protein FlhB [Roseobacter ponti]QJF52976.1 flagellar biosynthesis protein FlhB [Roseobacter ponti]
MSDKDDSSDKSFDATPQKLLDARKKGEFARSAELLTAAGYSGLLIGLLVSGFSALTAFSETLMIIIDQPDALATLFFSGAAGPAAGGLMASLAGAITPVFAFPALAVLLSLFALRGIVFAPEKIKPKLSKISPLQNAKNKFGRTGLFQFTVSTVKLTVYSVCLGVFLNLRLDDMVQAIHSNPFAIVALLSEVCLSFLVVVVVVSGVIGVIDAVWQHFEHLRKNRMSRKEVMDEAKNSEGDPHVKQERRKRAQTFAASQMMADVPAADVIIVNPTHYAVALRWDKEKGRAPVCVAKGVDEIAKTIREIARENDVPIHSNPPTARALYATTEIDQEIAPEHYKAVAAAIRFAEAMRRRSKEKFV